MTSHSESTPAKRIIQHTHELLNLPSAHVDIEPHIDALDRLYTSITGISYDACENKSDDAILEDGVAISPAQAARCLKEPIRTQLFLKGVFQAVNDKLTQYGKVDILYAGTGPYGVLVLPIVKILEDKEISVTLLDIHQKNITALEKVITTFGIASRVVHIEKADATRWSPAQTTHYDLVISETMSAQLRREPQVSIFAHLQQFLKEDGCLIPEKIKIGAHLMNGRCPPASQENLPPSTEHAAKPPIDLGTFFECNLSTVRKLHQGDATAFSGNIVLPSSFDTSNYHALKLTTTIDIYQDHQLTENQCTLNRPEWYHDLALTENGSIGYEYIFTNYPRFEFKFPQGKLRQKLPDIEETGALNIAHLKRFWCKSQLTAENLLDNKIMTEEWALDTQLLDLLGIPTKEALEFLYQKRPNFTQFEKWVSSNFPIKDPDKVNQAILDAHTA